MAGSVNKVFILGNVGRDPEVRSLQDGTKIVNFSLATSETWNDRASGERKEKTEWHRVVVFNDRIAEVVEKYVVRGSKVCVEGALQTRKWTDQSGQEKYSTEIVISKFKGDLTLLGDPAAGRDAPQRPAATTGGRTPGYGTPPARPAQSSSGWTPSRGIEPTNDLDDEIPF